MAVELVGVSTWSSTVNWNVQVTMPSNIQAGDVAFMYGATPASARTIDPAPGWSTLDVHRLAGSVNARPFQKLLDGSEGGSLQVFTTAFSGASVGALAVFRGLTVPFHKGAYKLRTSAFTIGNYPSITPTVEERFDIAFAAISNDVYINPADGWAEAVEINNASNLAASISYRSFSTGANVATPEDAFAVGGSTTHVTHRYAFELAVVPTVTPFRGWGIPMK